MKTERLIGQTLGGLAGQTGVFWRPIHLFLLDGKSDDTGKLLMTAYSLQQIIDVHPAAASATVISASEIVGETVLRVRIEAEEDDANE